MLLQPSEHQAAGHEGTLTDEDGSLFIKPTSSQEIEFYNQVIHHDEVIMSQQQPEMVGESKLSDWMPMCFGELKPGVSNQLANHDHGLPNFDGNINVVDDGKTYIVLENLYNNYKFPSILDIKLGSVLTDEDTTPEKASRLAKVAQETTSGSHHFRICGMKVYSDKIPQNQLFENMDKTIVSNGDYLEYNKIYGRSLNGDTIESGIYQFFKSLNHDLKIYCLLNQFHKRLQMLYNCLLDYEVRIFSGSLLFIYENDDAKWQGINLLDEAAFQLKDPLIKVPLTNDDDDDYDDDDSNNNINENKIKNSNTDNDQQKAETQDQITYPSSLSQLNLIDFAHSKFTPGKGHDDNVLQGIENLIIIFNNLIEKYKPSV